MIPISFKPPTSLEHGLSAVAGSDPWAELLSDLDEIANLLYDQRRFAQVLVISNARSRLINQKETINWRDQSKKDNHE